MASRSQSKRTPERRTTPPAASMVAGRCRKEGIMRQTDAIIIGAGQAGLAMSYCLGRLGIDNVVLERGRLAERWRSERWDSLRLLTPNWMTRLPGWPYRGAEPNGFMTKQEFVTHLEHYASI